MPIFSFYLARDLFYLFPSIYVLQIDVYSFGIVMWELLTGEEPYADMHCASIIGKCHKSDFIVVSVFYNSSIHSTQNLCCFSPSLFTGNLMHILDMSINIHFCYEKKLKIPFSMWVFCPHS